MNDRDITIARYLAGDATAAERAELHHELQQDPQQFAQFREDVRMHLALTAMLQPDDSRAIAEVIAHLRPATPNGETARLIRAMKPQVRKRKRRATYQRTHVTWLTLAAAACVAVGMLWAWQPPSAGMIRSVSGSVSVLRNGGSVPVASGSQLRQGDLLTTQSDGAIAWHDADGAEVTLSGGEGEARLAASPGGALMLVRGNVHAEVTPRDAGRSPYVIVTPLGAAQVLGTAFSLHVNDQAARLEVEHGRVRLTHLDTIRSVEVIAGESATLTRTRIDLDTAQPPALRAPDRVAFSLIQHTATRPSILAWGEVVAVPGEPDGWCLQGVNYAGNLEIYLQKVDPAATGLFLVPADGWLSFRYCIDQPGDSLSIYSQNQSTGKGTSATISPTTFGTWAVARVPWSAFRNDGSTAAAIHPGDSLLNLVVTANPPTPGRTLLIDDLECASPSTSTKPPAILP